MTAYWGQWKGRQQGDHHPPCWKDTSGVRQLPPWQDLHASIIGSAPRNPMVTSWPPHGRTPRVGWDIAKDKRVVLVAQDERNSHRIHEGMCNLSTKQDSYPSTKNSIIQDLNHPEYQTILAGLNGSNHWTPSTSRIWYNSHHCQSRMLSSHHIPPLHHYNHGIWYCPIISWSHLLLVWHTQQNNLWSRSSVYIALWHSIG